MTRILDTLQAYLEVTAAWVLALLWISPMVYAFWAAFHPGAYAVNFTLGAPLTLDNFTEALSRAPFLQYAFNTVALVTLILAAYALARFDFPGRQVVFALVLIQLMITPEILIVENYVTLARFRLVDTIMGIGLPYMASAFGIFLLRQAFKSTPRELEDAARLEGCGTLGVLWLAYALVSVSHHWNNFLWPLIITNSVETRPLTVGLGIFGAPESGVNWSIVSAATLLSVAPLLIAFLLFQRQFVQSFMYAGIK
jgi:sn-glycerol 3-phosphate transport system permease protein